MKLLGIDYGRKRIGIAESDESGMLAFPKGVIPNDRYTLGTISDLCKEKSIKTIVLGESKTLAGEPNEIFATAERFKNTIEQETGIPVVYEPEFYTSAQAERIQGNDHLLDARAAALILQSYIDKTKSTEEGDINP